MLRVKTRYLQRIHWASIFALAVVGFGPQAKSAFDPGDALFVVERSKNSNVVHYYAEFGNESEVPHAVHPQWVLHEENEKLDELNWFERRWAYGVIFKAKDTFTVVSFPEREIKLVKLEGKWRAIIQILGRPSKLSRVFIEASGGFIPDVQHIDLMGLSLDSNEDVTERIYPK